MITLTVTRSQTYTVEIDDEAALREVMDVETSLTDTQRGWDLETLFDRFHTLGYSGERILSALTDRTEPDDDDWTLDDWSVDDE